MNPATPEFWVMISFFLFVGILIYYKVPQMIAAMLDKRADAIRRELDEARRLREEAQALLADYQKKSREAESEAQAIIAQAKRESETLAAETRRSLAELLERQTKLTEAKIGRAEAQALGEVRAEAVRVAMLAAEKILKTRLAGGVGEALTDQSIRNLQGKLN